MSLWFILVLLIVIGSVVYVLFRVRISSLKRRQEEKTKLLVQNASLQLRSLQIQMNPHFIFNALSSVQYSILKNDIKASLSYLGNISSVIRTSLANANAEYIPLEEETEFLKKYIQIELLRFKEGLHIELINNCFDNNLLIPPMLVQPIIENAIKHGIAPRKEGGKISVVFGQTENALLITVEDNGIGREASLKLQPSGKAHYGLDVTRKRLNLLNELEKTDINRLDIIDILENGIPDGTQVNLTLAIRKS